MAARRTNPEFLNGVPELVILRLLAGRPMYGYELVQAIRQSSGQRLEFGEGCIYPILHRLEKESVLSSRREKVGGRSRVVYRVTEAGRKRLAGSTRQWRQVVEAVTRVLEGGCHDQPSVA